MNKPTPDHHSNPETVQLEPVYIFTDKAIVFPPKQPAAPRADQGKTEPTAGQSAEEK